VQHTHNKYAYYHKIASVKIYRVVTHVSAIEQPSSGLLLAINACIVFVVF